LFMLILLLLIHIPVAASAEVDDIWGLYTLAKTKDPSIGRAESRLMANRADEDTAFSRFLPRIDAQAGVNWITNTTYNYGPKTVDGAYQGHNYGVGARLPILQLTNYFTLNATKAASRSAESELKGIRQELISRICESYFGILKAQADEQLYGGEMKRLSKVHEQAQAFLKAGTGDIYTVYETRARLDSAASDLVRARSQRKIAEQQLASLTGRQVTTVKGLGEYTPRGAEPADLQWWVETMQKNQPSIIKAREDLAQMGEQLKSVKAGHMPVIQAQGGYSVSKGSTFLPEVETQQWYVGLNISLPLYSGGETMSRTRRSLAEESEQRYLLEETQEKGMLKLKEAFLTLELNMSLLNSLQQKKSSTEVQLAAATKGRSMGTRTLIEYMNAEQSHAVSQRDFSSALYDNAQRRLQLKAAAGILAEEDLKALNDALVDKGTAEP
jgi:outer membrane protein